MLVNPVIAESCGEWEYEEGCLSLPGLAFDIVRPKEVHLTGYNLDGEEVSIEADETCRPALFEHRASTTSTACCCSTGSTRPPARRR